MSHEFIKTKILPLKDDHAEKNVNKLPQFVSKRNYRHIRYIGKSPRDVKYTGLLSIMYNKNLTRHKKPKFKVVDRVRVSTKDIPFRTKYKPQITERKV